MLKKRDNRTIFVDPSCDSGRLLCQATVTFLFLTKILLLFSEPDFQGFALSTRTSEVIYADASSNGQRVAAVRISDGASRVIVGGVYPTALAVDNQEG